LYAATAFTLPQFFTAIQEVVKVVSFSSYFFPMPTLQSPSSITRWRSQFASAAIESSFLRDQNSVIQHESSRSLAFCAIFFMAFGLADAAQLGYSSETLTLFVARLVIGVVALLGIVLTRRSNNPAQTAYLVATVFTSLTMLVFLMVTYFRGDLLLHGMSMAIMLIIIYLFIPNRLASATVVAMGASAAFLTLVHAVDMTSPRQLGTMVMLLLLANLFGAVAARRAARSARRQYWTQQMLIDQSIRDPLTGAFNRRHLNSGLLEKEIERARRQGAWLTIIMCDLDDFKVLNDTHGHQAGDALLQDFAHMLLSMTRPAIDTVVRYGGEEFLVILPDTNLSEGHTLAELIRSHLAEASNVHGQVTIKATASFGVVSVCLSPCLPNIASHTLIARADGLMYAAKRTGRNRVHGSEWDATKLS
jgi:diguanylate cyclase (GGDEF)-like protein